MVTKCGVAVCLGEAGDVSTYETLILHGSERASAAVHRRVLQVGYAVDDFPGGLEWFGV